MAHPETCAGALLAMKDSAAYSVSYSNYATAHRGDAYTHWSANQDHNAIEDILRCLTDVITAAGYAGYGYTPFDNVGPWWWYFTNCIEAPTFDMSSLINAMLLANPVEVEYFVGLVDAYRQSIWNRPFNKEFYAGLARGFEQWP